MPSPGKSFEVSLRRKKGEILGMTIGGGAPHSPVIYVVQVFPQGKVSAEGTLEPGDEVTHVNGESTADKPRQEVAKMIKSSEEMVRISGVKLDFKVIDGITVDILFNDFKHRMLDHLSPMLSEQIGLTHAMLVNDDFVKRFALLEKNEKAFKELSVRINNMLKAFKDQCTASREIADVFEELARVDRDAGRRQCSQAIAEAHRQMSKSGLKCIQDATPVIADMRVFLQKTIPDTRQTMNNYLEVKYVYLSFCLKVQLLDEEEAFCTRDNKPLSRLKAGNVEYRVALRCQYMCKQRFNEKRRDVTEKLYLLDNKRMQDLTRQLCKFATSMQYYLRQSLSAVNAVDYRQLSQFDLANPALVELSKEAAAAR